jgi:hypothetical protein
LRPGCTGCVESRVSYVHAIERRLTFAGVIGSGFDWPWSASDATSKIVSVIEMRVWIRDMSF